MTLWQNMVICSNPGLLLEPRKNYLQRLYGDLMQKSYLLGPTTWKVMQRNVWIDIANLRIRRLNSYTKSQHHSWMSIKIKKKKNQWENCLQYAHKLFLKCLHLAQIERPDIVWSVNKVARADTKWTKSCDEILMRLISHMHHTSEHR